MSTIHARPSSFPVSVVFAIVLETLSGSAAGAAEPRVSNREPKPGEVGYRPADGSTVRLNPPSWIWLHEPEASTYEVQWSPEARFEDAARTASADLLPFNAYTHREPFAPGTYFWRYRFKSADGRVSAWSATRSVVVPPDAVAFPMPTRAEQRSRIPEGHPRLFLRPEDLPRLREAARGSGAVRGGGAERSAQGGQGGATAQGAGDTEGGQTAAALFESLRRDAERIIRNGPTPEPTHLGSARDKRDKELVKYWWPNREQTLKACQEAETLAFVYLIAGEERYGEAARRWILHLASWDPDGPTNFRLNCEAAKPLIYRLPRAYDWAHDALTAEDRARVQAAMRRRARDAWESGEIQRGTGHLNSPFSSHGNRIWHKLGECGIAFLGEIPEAETWLDYAITKFFACYPVWSDDEGGWHEGVSYWAGYMGKVVWWLQTARSALEIDGLRKPFFSQVGDFPLYVAPPGSPNCGFGDLSFRPPSSSWGGFLEYFVRAASAPRPARPGDGGDGGESRAPYWRWWMERWGMRGEGGILGFLYAANLPPLPAARPPSDLPPSKVFRGIGVASLHHTLLDATEDVHVLFKSSPFGTQSHGHNPHNSFQLNAYGEPLLVTCVYRDLHGSDFHYRYAHSTAAHNAVLVDRKGQIQHTPAPHGRIADFRLEAGWDYVVGDATAAYGGRLARYRRHVAFLKPDAIVLYDDLVALEPATYQFLLHALKPFRVEEDAARLSVELPRAGVDVAYLSPEPLAFRQWDGYDPPPDREFPNQWHVEAGTREKRATLGMLTVIVPYRAGKRVDWTARRIEEESAVGVRLERGGEAALVGFRKEGVTGPAEIEGEAFEGPVLVK
jgi:hypothetical protein